VRRLAVLFVGLLVWMLDARSAAAVTVRVRGGTTIDLLVTEGAETLIRGEVTDDDGASLGRVTVRIEATLDGKPYSLDPSRSSGGLPEPRPVSCNVGKQTTPELDRGAYVVTADDRGDFCIKRSKVTPGLTFKVSFVGNNFFDGSDQAVQATPESEQRARTILHFESPPAEIDLDKPDTSFVVSLKVDRQDADRLAHLGTFKREGLTIVLSDEAGHEVADATTGGDGRARFTVSNAKAGAPGDGELRAQFRGDGILAPSNATAPVMRTAAVTIAAAQPKKGEPESGIPIPVDVTSEHGVVDGGIVEAFIGDDSVGSARVENGKAKLVAVFPAAHRDEIPVSIRYVPAAPWWRAARPTEVTVPLSGPSIWRHVVLGLLVAAVAAWIVAKWRRAPQIARGDSTSLIPPSGRPEILVLDRPSGLRGWKGTVTDAHEGYPIANATLKVVVPTFEGDQPLAETKSDEVGAFAIEVDKVDGARLLVEGDFHAVHQQVLPPPSVIRVALVTRRRALLDRLVRWAKLRGAPYDGHKEPTPGHVRRVASRADATEVETWARKLEHAAFSDSPVTRDVESQVRDAEPRAPGQELARKHG